MRLFTSHDQKNLEIADKIITYLDLKDEDGLYSLFSEQVIEEDEALKDGILALFSSYHGSVVKYEERAIGVETKIEKGDKLSGISKNSVRFLEMPDRFQFKSLYYNDLNRNIATKLKENL